MITELTHSFQDINIPISEEQLNKLEKFYNMVIDYNKKINLTTITDINEFITKHYIDSLSLYNINNENLNIKTLLNDSKIKILDIGTGAGFPGIPLSIVFSNPDYTLLDSLQKRICFISKAVSELKLNNVNPIHGRAEDYAKKTEHREKYDICVSRAVANLSTLAEYALPFVKISGYFIAYKGSSIEKEINESQKSIAEMGGILEKINTFSLYLKNEEIKRTFVIIKKIDHTPKKYPRKNGIPSKKPL